EILGQVQRADGVLDVGEVAKAVRGGHTRGELQLDQLFEGHDTDSSLLHGNFGRVRENNGLGLAVAGILAGGDHVHPDAGVSGAERFLRPGEGGGIAAAKVELLESDEAFGSQQQVDVYGHTAVAVASESDGAEDRVVDATLLQPPGQVVQGLVELARFHEICVRFPEEVVEALAGLLLVVQHLRVHFSVSTALTSAPKRPSSPWRNWGQSGLRLGKSLIPWMLLSPRAARRSACGVKAGGGIASRPMRGSRALYTSPMPPVPSGARISQEPSCVPAASGIISIPPRDRDRPGAASKCSSSTFRRA